MMIRFIDIILSAAALMLLSPIFFVVALVLRFTGEGEVLYVQPRVGRDGALFGLVKFATMLKNSPSMGAGEITLKGDSRILPFGGVLRKTKVNELPQLWNVLVGDMSLVGPRPMVPNTFEKYSDDAQRVLNLVRPGLSGIGSIIFRDEEKFLDRSNNPQDFYNSEIIPFKSDLEVWFVKNFSFGLYCKIVFVTIWVIVFSESKLPGKLFHGIPDRPGSLFVK